MTRVRIDLFSSLDGFTADPGTGSDDSMGDSWSRLTESYGATRTFRSTVLGMTDGSGTIGVDDGYVAGVFEGVGAEIMGATMFGLHAYPDDPDWQGWWGEDPPFGHPVYVLTHTAPRPSIPMRGGTTFHFRSGSCEDVLAEAAAAAEGGDVRIGGGISTAHQFLEAGLVDQLHLTIAPIVLGHGIPVWEGLGGLDQTHDVRSEVGETGTLHVTFTRKGQP